MRKIIFKFIVSRVAFSFFILFVSNLFAIDALDRWYWLNPKPQGNSLNGVGFVDGKFIAVGVGGTILHSTNGADWTVVQSRITTDLNGVGGAASKLVAVGANGSILTSMDGNIWTQQKSPSNATLSAVAYGNGRFIAVGDKVLLTSVDSVNWTQQSVPAWVRGVTFGNGTFVAVGDDIRLSSQDGISWMTNNLADLTNGLSFARGATAHYKGIAYGSGYFVALTTTTILWQGRPSTQEFQTSRSIDGVNWVTQTPLTNIGPFMNLTFGNDTYVSYGYQNISNLQNYLPSPMTSVDGLNWSVQPATLPPFINSFVFGNGIFVAVGNAGSIATSPDAVVWTQMRNSVPDASGINYGMAEVSNHGVIVGGYSNSVGFVLSFTNGDPYSFLPQGTPPLNSVASDSIGRFVAVGSSGTLLTSDDGINWSNRNPNTSASLNDVAYGNGRYVAVGNNGTAITSIAGNAWGLFPQFTTSQLRGVTYGNGIWITVGAGGTVFTSPNTSSWDPQDPGTSANLNKVYFGDGMFISVGDGGIILTSTNGVVWTTQVSGTSNSLRAVSYHHGIWLVAGVAGTLLSSYDGISWTKRSSQTIYDLAGVGFSGSSFTLIGDGNCILQSASLDNPLLVEPQHMPNGKFKSRFVGPIGVKGTLQSTETPFSTTWSPVLQFTNTTGVTLLEDPTAMGVSTRFYRVAP